MTLRPEFKYDSDKLEKQLRFNFSIDIHTKESLINCAVEYALSWQSTEIELENLKRQYFEETAGINFLRQVLAQNNKSDLSQLAYVIEKHFKNPYFADLLKNAHKTSQSHKGSSGGTASQADNQNLRQEAYKYWKENIDPQLSGRAAAKILTKQIPMSEKTLASWVTKDFKNRKN